MPVITIKSLDEPGVEVYSRLTDHQLRQDASDPNGLFIAESPKVIRVAMAAGFQPLSMLCEERHIEGDAADIIREAGDIPVYTGDRALLTELTGYKLTRGVLCAMRRKVMPTPADICKGKRRIAVIQGVCDTTNIGSIFRGRLGHRSGIAHPGQLRPAQPKGGQGIDGIGIPGSLDMDRRTCATAQRHGIQDGSHGFGAQRHLARRPEAHG